MGFLLEKCRLVKVNNKILASCYPFTCGDDDLDDFFLNDAMRYKEELLGKTYCFVLDDNPRKIVCMFTLSNDSIRVDVIPNNRGRKLSKDIPREKVDWLTDWDWKEILNMKVDCFQPISNIETRTGLLDPREVTMTDNLGFGIKSQFTLVAVQWITIKSIFLITNSSL